MINIEEPRNAEQRTDAGRNFNAVNEAFYEYHGDICEGDDPADYLKHEKEVRIL